MRKLLQHNIMAAVKILTKNTKKKSLNYFRTYNIEGLYI